AILEPAGARPFARSSAGYDARARTCFVAGMDSWLGPGDRLANVPVTLAESVDRRTERSIHLDTGRGTGSNFCLAAPASALGRGASDFPQNLPLLRKPAATKL